MSNLKDLMQETYLAQRKFNEEWKNWKSGKIKRTKSKKEKRDLRELEPDSVTKARKEYLEKVDYLYDSKIIPLEINFKENPHTAMDEMLEFLSIDILVFRGGYVKAAFIDLLKKVDLTENEIEKVQRVAFQVCKTDSIHREFRRWCRLMNKIADKDFVLKLQKLLKSENENPRLKAKWTLEMIYQNRTSLREFIEK